MAESLSKWLALREAADVAARSESLTRLVVERLGPARPLRVLDLGTGTGSNIRYLAPRLHVEQQWLAVDKDPRLLAEVSDRRASIAPDVQIDTRALDLGAPLPSEIFDGRHLVTASALLDLVSTSWLERVACECRRVGACALFTITYNGWNECDPGDADDEYVFGLFNQHQLTDKGLGGPAAGPRGTDVARDCFGRAGFDVRIEPSNWHIASDACDLQRQLIEGWACAAAEIALGRALSGPPGQPDKAPPEQSRVEAWKRRRLAHVAARRSMLAVGHYDLAGLTPIANRES